MEVKGLNDIKTVEKSMDDSFGESFDKVAKMMGLGYPGGPVIEKLAKDGSRDAFKFTVPLHQSPLIAFSYSGLKNALRLAIEAEGDDRSRYKDIAASFEYTATKHITMKLKKYFKTNPPKRFAIVGGASANLYLRGEIEKLLKPYNAQLLLSELKYCSDNAAMIGRVAIDMYNAKEFSSIEELKVIPKSKI
jgi:N6-L-threonylcarbamoyladenine synthase